MEIEVAGHQVDCGFSDTISSKASANQRPQFAALLAQICNGKTLMVSKPDRMGRDAQTVGATVNPLAVQKISVIVLQPGKMDLVSVREK